MGAFTGLFGTSPRVAVVEAFAENPDDKLSVPEIVAITGVSKRGAYMHTRRLLDEGILVKSGKIGKCQLYEFNENDSRGEALTFLADVLALGGLESRIKMDEGIPFDQPFPFPKRFEPRSILNPPRIERKEREEPSDLRPPFPFGTAALVSTAQPLMATAVQATLTWKHITSQAFAANISMTEELGTGVQKLEIGQQGG